MAEGQQLKAVTIKRGKDAPVAMSGKCLAIGEELREERTR